MGGAGDRIGCTRLTYTG